MVDHVDTQGEENGTTYKVTVRNVAGHTTVGNRNRVSGGIGAPTGPDSAVTSEQVQELRDEFARVRGLIEEADGAGEREKGAAADRLEELEESITGDQPDVRTMTKVHAWFAQRLPAVLGAVSSLLLHPTAALLAQAAGEDVAARFGELLQSLGSAAGES
ncbi:hypothetical protein [Streptomyces pacificus]|uniref:Uncharacterized protein n=1 Tax=Streptomyces pacificus TaxID=2705029 RepID=A0A6A0ASY3_9ACTN|nr:hypothetical protein [Streptomyces pacificus]GFH36026.1 hypothetical protein SCWH03_22480 [Streptomyces pacificus]